MRLRQRQEDKAQRLQRHQRRGLAAVQELQVVPVEGQVDYLGHELAAPVDFLKMSSP